MRVNVACMHRLHYNHIRVPVYLSQSVTYSVPSLAKLEARNLWIFSTRLRHFQRQYSALDKYHLGLVSTPKPCPSSPLRRHTQGQILSNMKSGESSILRRWKTLVAATSNNMTKLNRSPQHRSQFPIHVFNARGPSLSSDRPVENNSGIILSIASSVLDYLVLPSTANRSLSLMFSHK